MTCDKTISRWIFVVVAATSVSSAIAQVPGNAAPVTPKSRYNLVLKTGAGYSDNVGRRSADEQSSLIAIAGAELSITKPQGRLQADALADISFLRYFDSDVLDKNDVVGDLSARARYEVLPDRLYWVAEDQYAQIRENFLLPSAPGNRQPYNRLSTGPDLRFRLGSAFDVETQLRYGRTDYGGDNAQFDTQQYSGTLLLTRQISPRSGVSIAARQERFEVDTPVGVENRDFDRREAFVRLRTQTRRMAALLEAGTSDVDGAVSEDSGPLLRATIDRALTPSLRLQLNASRQFATTGEQPRRFLVTDTIDLSDDLLLPAAEPYEETRYGVGLSYRRPRTSLTIAASRSESDFEAPRLVTDPNFDRETTSYSVTFNRRLTPRVDFTLRAVRDQDELISESYDVADQSFTGTLQWRLTRSFGLGFNIEQRKRSGGLLGDNFSELSSNVLLRYSPWTPDAGLENAAGTN